MRQRIVQVATDRVAVFLAYLCEPQDWRRQTDLVVGQVNALMDFFKARLHREYFHQPCISHTGISSHHHDWMPDASLLGLPLELRHYIYDQVAATVLVSEDALGWPYMWLENVPLMQLMLTCTQIHDEYVQRCRHRGNLRIHTIGHVLPEIRFRGSALDLLVNVGLVVFTLSWLSAVKTRTQEEVREFVFSVRASGVKNHRCFLMVSVSSCTTKSNASEGVVFRDKIRLMLRELESFMHGNAKVLVKVDMKDMPDPDDPCTWPPDTRFPIREIVRIWSALVDMRGMFAMAHDRSLSWPRPGNLQVIGVLDTPLYCSMARNSREVFESLRALERGEIDTVVWPDFV